MNKLNNVWINNIIITGIILSGAYAYLNGKFLYLLPALIMFSLTKAKLISFENELYKSKNIDNVFVIINLSIITVLVFLVLSS